MLSVILEISNQTGGWYKRNLQHSHPAPGAPCSGSDSSTSIKGFNGKAQIPFHKQGGEIPTFSLGKYDGKYRISVKLRSPSALHLSWSLGIFVVHSLWPLLFSIYPNTSDQAAHVSSGILQAWAWETRNKNSLFLTSRHGAEIFSASITKCSQASHHDTSSLCYLKTCK